MSILDTGFGRWFKRNLGEYAEDIANHGADAGYPHITYFTDTDKIYKKYEDEIYEMLSEDADEFGYSNIDAFTSTFRLSDMLNDPVSRRCLLVWYACERCAREMTD